MYIYILFILLKLEGGSGVLSVGVLSTPPFALGGAFYLYPCPRSSRQERCFMHAG